MQIKNLSLAIFTTLVVLRLVSCNTEPGYDPTYELVGPLYHNRIQTMPRKESCGNLNWKSWALNRQGERVTVTCEWRGNYYRLKAKNVTPEIIQKIKKLESEL